MTADKMKNVAFVNPEQAKRAILLNWKASGYGAKIPIPTLLVGGTGSAKSSLVSELRDELNAATEKKDFGLWKWILSQKDPTEIGGVQMPNQERTHVTYLLPAELPFDGTDRGVIFADELDRCQPDTQNTFLQVMLDREINGHALSPNAYVVAAMNGVSDIFTTPLSEAARTRVCSIFLSAHAQGTLDGWMKYAEMHDIDPVLRGFAKFRPELIEQREDFEELAMMNPRTRDMAGQIISASRDAKFETADVLLPCLAGVIGKGPAIELLAYKEIVDKCPDPEAIIAHPKTAQMPEEPHVLYAIGSALISRVKKDDRKLAVAVATYAQRMPDELAAFTLRRLAERCPAVVTSAVYQKWCDEHSMLIM